MEHSPLSALIAWIVENQCDFIKDQRHSGMDNTCRFSDCSIDKVKADHADIRGALEEKHYLPSPRYGNDTFDRVYLQVAEEDE